MQYIPMFARGEITEREYARLIGIAPFSVWRLKTRWLEFGDAIWIHGNTGRTPKNKKYDWDKIAADYAFFAGTPFASFRDDCADYLHDWFMNGQKVTLHGAIDDATHKVVALYFCVNECLLGYYQLLWQIFTRTGGLLPCAIYSDRSQCFFTTRGSTLEEQLAGAEKSETQWQKTCRELKIELIAAYLLPAGKGAHRKIVADLAGEASLHFPIPQNRHDRKG